MLKKRVVASVVGNFSPVKRRTEIFVRSCRHFRGDMGDSLNFRAVQCKSKRPRKKLVVRTFLEDRRPIQLESRLTGILILLCVTHRDAQDLSTECKQSRGS